MYTFWQCSVRSSNSWETRILLVCGFVFKVFFVSFLFGSVQQTKPARHVRFWSYFEEAIVHCIVLLSWFHNSLLMFEEIISYSWHFSCHYIFIEIVNANFAFIFYIRSYGQPLACAAVLQSMPVSCHFRGCKAPLSRIVSGAISSELPLPFTFYLHSGVIILSDEIF